jgi:hypothetical protein
MFEVFINFINEHIIKCFNIYFYLENNIQHIFILLLNFILFVFAKKIVTFFENKKEEIDTKVKIFRFFNVAFFVLHFCDLYFVSNNTDYENIFFKIGITGLIFYFSYFLSLFFSHFNRKKFGIKRKIDDKDVNIETYSSRLTSLLINISLFFVTIIIVIQYWGYNSLFESTSIFGILLAFFAFTFNVWGPNLINGLVLLNSNLYSEGDIIEFDENRYILYKIEYFRTVLLNIKNEHRSSISNTNLSNKILDNITKLASPRGFRETIEYNIGYNINYKDSKENRLEQLKKNKLKIKEMLTTAYEECLKRNDIFLSEREEGFQLLLLETGDFALKYEVAFHIINPKSTNTTSNARNYLKTRSLINEIIFEKSIEVGIDLSTPYLFKKEN